MRKVQINIACLMIALCDDKLQWLHFFITTFVKSLLLWTKEIQVSTELWFFVSLVALLKTSLGLFVSFSVFHISGMLFTSSLCVVCFKVYYISGSKLSDKLLFFRGACCSSMLSYAVSTLHYMLYTDTNQIKDVITTVSTLIYILREATLI